jgi:hypothetical protein
MAKRIVTRSLFIPRSKPFPDGIPFPPWPEPIKRIGKPETLRLRTRVLGRGVRAKFCAAGAPTREAALREGLCNGQLLRRTV